MVLPFHDVLTSGAAITALGFGRPVIVPKLGCLPELVNETATITYDPILPNGLLGALKEAKNRDLITAGKEAFRIAEELSWDRIAKMTLEAYQHEGGYHAPKPAKYESNGDQERGES